MLIYRLSRHVLQFPTLPASFLSFKGIFQVHQLKLVSPLLYFTLAKIYLLRLFKMAADQSASGWNRDLSLNIWWLRSENCKIYRKIWYVWISMFLSKNIYQGAKHEFIDELNMCLSLWVWAERTGHGVKRHSPVKKKFRVQLSVKKVLLMMFKDMKCSSGRNLAICLYLEIPDNFGLLIFLEGFLFVHIL